jgi:hypothetical protein
LEALEDNVLLLIILHAHLNGVCEQAHHSHFLSQVIIRTKTKTNKITAGRRRRRQNTEQ